MNNLIVNIANHEFPYIEDNIYYFALSDYPNISDWELRKLILFVDYEKRHKRNPEIVCGNNEIMQAVSHALANPALYLSAQKPSIITECTACRQNGCLTDYLCHTASIENAKSIFKCGKILSAVRARNRTGVELVAEPRNAAKDPPDYFDYIMMSWGNCQAGDRLVMERMLGRFPDEHDLSLDFRPGVRFYFKYDFIKNHRDFTEDGNHPAKIKDELSLSDYLYRCIIPENYMTEFENIIPSFLFNRVFYIENECKDIWDWSEKVYDFVCGQNVQNIQADR